MSHLLSSLRVFFVLTLVLGLAYPLVIFGIGQGLFPHQANGSLVSVDRGHGPAVVGSHLLGQDFHSPQWFVGRPSVYNSKQPYDGLASGGSNLTPAGAPLKQAIRDRAATWLRLRPGVAIPGDLLSASASSLDPELSPAAARYQVPIVAAARQLKETEVAALVESLIKTPPPILPGEKTINVLELNLALEKLTQK